MKYPTHVFRSLLLLLTLMILTDMASAQPSLIFTDTAGRRVAFTRYGTIVYGTIGNPDQNIVSRGYEVFYGINDNNRRAWYLNDSYQSGTIVPVSLTSNKSSGQLSDGTMVYVRAVVRTADNNLTITHRYIWRVGSPGIEAVVTVKNNSDSPLQLKEVSILTPRTPSAPVTRLTPVMPDQYSCHCLPVVAYDGSVVESTPVTIPPDMQYCKTTASYPPEPLPSEDSVDVPGCDLIPGESPTSSTCATC